MNDSTGMLEFVKAVSDAERLRIIGVLAARSASVAQIASELKISLREAVNHLGHLEQVGVIRARDKLYSLEVKELESKAKKQFEGKREEYIPAPDLDKKTRKVLAAYLMPDGSIKQVPLHANKLRILLTFLVNVFTPGLNYTEREVNTLLRRFNEDTAGLRRDLVDAGLLDREADGSRYWRKNE
jgi:hypothetical protein